MPLNGTCGGTCRLVSLAVTQSRHVCRGGLVAQRQACDDSLPQAAEREGKVDNARRLRTAVSGPHACRAAADDLNTALGGDLKLTTFGPRLPELSREVELGDFFGRRVFGEPLLTAASRGDAPGEDGSIAREERTTE